MRLEFNWQRRLAASLMLLAACSMPAASWGADCGVDGGAIREAALRGLNAQNNLLNQSAADVMRASRIRMACLERFGLTQIPPLGIPGGSIVMSLANGAMERACQQAAGTASRYLSDATGGLTSLAGGTTLPNIGSINLDSGLNGTLGTAVNGVVNGAVNNATGAVTGAVSGAISNAGNQLNTQVQQQQQSVWSRMGCWVTGNC
ncbi:MAG: hypothetical protein K0Q43_47 [Ramlibacter sp.]|jgi:hypothetical protein|nr:hypothetical protein [Ramlibacter sp.]